MIYTLKQLIEWSVQKEIRPRFWVPARPLDGPFTYRMRAAWEVFRGRADAFTWPEGQ